jgi:hypothetical protein
MYKFNFVETADYQGEQFMKKYRGGAILPAVIVLLAIGGSIEAQTAEHPKAVPAAPVYQASKEVTLEGTVANVVTKPTAGMLIGAHAILATPTGNVDAHLGSYAMKGSNPLTLTPGERVQVVGVMETLAKGNKVFLVRTIQAGSHTYTIRNEHGALIMTSVKRVQGGQK